ncbi:hypothetical protein EON65_55365 [archaeon]|nr:MAG: hypothetical protein EON65_55365 [archaeon]
MAECIEAPKLTEEEATRLLHEQNVKQLDKLQIEGTEGKEEAEGDEEEEDEEEDGNTAPKAGEGGKKKRKKKKKPAKKKGNKGAEGGGEAGAGGLNSTSISPPLSRLLGGSTNYFMRYGQTFPPTRPVSELFPRGGFPVGEIQPHGKTKYPDPQSTWVRTTEEERR